MEKTLECVCEAVGECFPLEPNFQTMIYSAFSSTKLEIVGRSQTLYRAQVLRCEQCEMLSKIDGVTLRVFGRSLTFGCARNEMLTPYYSSAILSGCASQWVCRYLTVAH
eukprot:768599-Hanusia_phi.AAC.4